MAVESIIEDMTMTMTHIKTMTNYKELLESCREYKAGVGKLPYIAKSMAIEIDALYKALFELSSLMSHKRVEMIPFFQMSWMQKFDEAIAQANKALRGYGLEVEMLTREQMIDRLVEDMDNWSEEAVREWARIERSESLSSLQDEDIEIQLRNLLQRKN